MKQGVLINTVFLPTKWSVNHCTISGTRHLNKYLIKQEQNTCMFDKKNPSQFLVNVNGIYSAINEGGVCCLWRQRSNLQPRNTSTHCFWCLCATPVDMKMWEEEQQEVSECLERVMGKGKQGLQWTALLSICCQLMW